MKAETTTEIPDLETLEATLVERWDRLFAAARCSASDSERYRLLVEALLETGRELAATRLLRRVAPDSYHRAA